ncbi:hypothetical protein D6D12_07801 [Aureobasidium pullulans]|uniref:V-type proton ATPase subunit G n=1 Tax=Aureobasidium pullulans TaxID=5580 RepID=A0AB74JKL4_AURPU|nr:hypothetical protein D6D12_07801 [Aureobasidium pullulans]THX40803.1 hypothetical protein D6D11_08609 [Aureobasidium pullulans]
MAWMGRISNGTLGPQLGGHHQHPPVGQQPSPVQSSYQLIHHGTLYRMEELLPLMDRMLTVASVCTKLGRNPNAARHRTKRVKDARSEAQKEIDEYRNKKEEEFKQFSTQHTSGNEQAEKDAGKETDEKLKEIKSIGDKEGHTVVENLLRAVTDVKPQVPDRVEQPVA